VEPGRKWGELRNPLETGFKTVRMNVAVARFRQASGARRAELSCGV
jgi:hypothetical protein